MILIDAIYINNSGGLVLLKYLLQELHRRDCVFYLLADDRCLGIFDTCEKVTYLKASLSQRRSFYKAHKDSFSSVLCFGNIPAPIKMDVPVYTYFHNINLLTLSEAHNAKERIIMWLKRQVFRYYKANTDFWLVQTQNTANELTLHLKERFNRIKILPFYNIVDGFQDIAKRIHGGDYVFVSNYTGAKGHEELLDAWRLLHTIGINKCLHLTVPLNCRQFIEAIDQAKSEGINVINHGFIPFERVLDLYLKSKAIIYPSHNESLGLGIIEAITAGCDVLGADLPYIHSVCKPSVTFNPYSAHSIANAVMEYEKGYSARSVLIIKNQINELIALISSQSIVSI